MRLAYPLEDRRVFALGDFVTFRKSFLTLAIASAFGPASIASAAPMGNQAVGGEMQVNSVVSGPQERPDIAMSADGSAVVTWVSREGLTHYVRARRYAPDGRPLGPDFAVSSADGADAGTHRLFGPSQVAMNAAGNFVIVWGTYHFPERTGDIYARRYDASGSALGPAFVVNSVTDDLQRNPRIAMDDQGNFVVAFESERGSKLRRRVFGASYGLGVYVQRFRANGQKVGGEMRVSNSLTAGETLQEVSMNAGSGFTVLWYGHEPDEDQTILAKSFSPSGGATSGDIQIAGPQRFISSATLAKDRDGDFLVSWVDNGGIKLRRYDDAGGAEGEALQLFPQGEKRIDPKIAMDADGDFVLSHARGGEIDGSGDFIYAYAGYYTLYFGEYGVFAQRYSADMLPVGEEFLVNTETYNNQYRPAVAMDADGDVMIAWEGGGDFEDQDTDNSGIFAQRYTGPENVDLALSQTQNVDPAPGYSEIGGEVTYSFELSNQRPISTQTGTPTVDAAIGVATSPKVVARIRDGASLLASSGEDWSCRMDDPRLICTYDQALFAGQTAPILQMTLRMPSLPGSVAISGRALGREYDALASNDTATVNTPVCDPASVDHIDVFNGVVAENAGSGQVRIQRQGGSCAPLSVEAQTLDDNAESPADYLQTNVTLQWAAGESGIRTFPVTIIDDANPERNERIKLRLSNGGAAVLGPDASLQILDDDAVSWK